MNTTLPPALAPFIKQCLASQSLTLLTSVLDTPANWLLVRLLAAYSQGQHISNTNELVQSRPVILVSLWRSVDLWSGLTKKVGISLQDHLATTKKCYIDGLSGSQVRPGPPKAGHIVLKSLTLSELDNAITQALRTLTAQTLNVKPLLLIDGLDFLLAMQQLSHVDVQNLLLKWQAQLSNVVVTCSADSALLHNADMGATPLELNHTNLARSLAHQAQWIFQLRPLETGKSKEVSGSIRISKGGSPDEAEDGTLEDGEWLYHLKGDGSVRVWARGEA